MRTLVLAYGSGDAASTTYRYRACQSLWASQGHELEIVAVKEATPEFWSRLGSFDAIINQKALLSGRMGKRVFGSGRPVFFDFDDAIWTRPRRPYSWWTQWRVNSRIRYWFGKARRVFAANEHLAAFARRYRERVTVLPMALDLESWRPGPPRPTGRIRIGWNGSPGNLWHLERLGGVLRDILQRNPRVELAVLCGQRPKFDFDHEYIPFSPGREIEFVQGLDIGLLPLQYEPYTLGKSPIKALQYLGCAVPVVGEVRGATAEMLQPGHCLAVESESQWLEALQRLIDHPADRMGLGEAGRRFVDRHHNLSHVTREFLKHLEETAEDRQYLTNQSATARSISRDQ